MSAALLCMMLCVVPVGAIRLVEEKDRHKSLNPKAFKLHSSDSTKTKTAKLIEKQRTEMYIAKEDRAELAEVQPKLVEHDASQTHIDGAGTFHIAHRTSDLSPSHQISLRDAKRYLQAKRVSEPKEIHAMPQKSPVTTHHSSSWDKDGADLLKAMKKNMIEYYQEQKSVNWLTFAMLIAGAILALVFVAIYVKRRRDDGDLNGFIDLKTDRTSSETTSTTSRDRYLKDRIERFEKRLQEHKRVVEARDTGGKQSNDVAGSNEKLNEDGFGMCNGLKFLQSQLEKLHDEPPQRFSHPRLAGVTA
jgi:hypothetical protein